MASYLNKSLKIVAFLKHTANYLVLLATKSTQFPLISLVLSKTKCWATF